MSPRRSRARIGGLLLAGILCRSARADHEPATPRSVVELQLGPLRFAGELPKAFRGCKPQGGGFPEEQGLAFFSAPEDDEHSVLLVVAVDCLNDKKDVVPCTDDARRFVKGLRIEDSSHPYHRERLRPRCQLPLPPDRLSTSRGIRLGDSYEKVIGAYGPPSVNHAVRGSREPLYVVYTKGRDAGDARDVQFRFNDRKVAVISIEGPEGDMQWKK